MDLTTDQVRFIIDHHGWPRPFWWPRVTEFAIAEKDEGEMWQLKTASPSGELAHQLAIIYGEIPPGFVQIFPEKSEKPRPLALNKNYFVAAAGPKSVYRMVFAMPIDPRFERPKTSSQPDEQDPDFPPLDP